MPSVYGQDKSHDKHLKAKPDDKSLEMLKDLNSEEPDILFKNPVRGKLDSYLAEVSSKATSEKNVTTIKAISLELTRVFTLIDNGTLKSSNGNKIRVKKISDLVDNKNNSGSIFVAVGNGDYLLRCSSNKPLGALAVVVDQLDYLISESVFDDNWGITLYEWEKKPTKDLSIVKMDSCGPIGSIVYKMDQMGCISAGIISNITNFEYKEIFFKSFSVNSLEVVNDGDYFFNEKGNLMGVAYLGKGKTIILDGLFISRIANDLFKTLGTKSVIGVLGNIIDLGFQVKEVLKTENKLYENDIIEEVDNIKITKENLYSIKQKFKRKKKIELKVFRENKHEIISCNLNIDFALSQMKSFSCNEYKKIILWIDPLDHLQLSEAIKFIASCKQFGVETYDLKFYRLNEVSLIDWLATVKLIRFLLLNKKSEVFEWFKNNPYQESADYFAKLTQQFALNKVVVGDILANSEEEKAILEDYINGMLKHHILDLPAISLANGKGVSMNQDFECWIHNLFNEYGL